MLEVCRTLLFFAQMMPSLIPWSVQGSSLGVALLRGLLCCCDHALDWGVAAVPLSVAMRMKDGRLVLGICMCICEIPHGAERSWGKMRRETGYMLSQYIRRPMVGFLYSASF